MKTLFLSLLVFAASTSLKAQETLHLTVGNTHQHVTGFELLPDSLNLSQTSYYNIVDGYFDYFVINEFDGKIIQFDHIYCPIKSLNIKKPGYNANDEFTTLTIATINDEPDVQVHSWKVDGTKTSKQEFTADKLELFIPNEEVGKMLLKLIKKGDDL